MGWLETGEMHERSASRTPDAAARCNESPAFWAMLNVYAGLSADAQNGLSGPPSSSQKLSRPIRGWKLSRPIHDAALYSLAMARVSCYHIRRLASVTASHNQPRCAIAQTMYRRWACFLCEASPFIDESFAMW